MHETNDPVLSAHSLNGNGRSSHPPTHQSLIEEAVRTILACVGEDPAREGLLNTPHRVAKMYDELLVGYHTDLETLVNGALFEVEYDDMVVVWDIEYYSLCEHHLLPFYGRAHVAYLAGEKIIGLSKIPRIVDMFARRLQVQERLTRQIAEALAEVLRPKGVAVVVEGSHLCAMMRGVQKEQPRMVTQTFLGQFQEDVQARRAFLDSLKL